MKRKEYRDFLQHVLYDLKLRRILMTDIYNTKYYLNTEYLGLFAKGNARLYYLHLPFALDSELDFYLHLDMLTYLPFEKLGYEYLNNELLKENSNVIERSIARIPMYQTLNTIKIDTNAKTAAVIANEIKQL